MAARWSQRAIAEVDLAPRPPPFPLQGSDVAENGVGLNIGLKGENGLELREYWKSIGGPQAYLGVSVPQFPNYFTTLGPNAIAGSWGYTIGVKTAYIARIVRGIYDNGLSSIQPKQEPFEELNREIREKLAPSTMNSLLCSNWWRVGGQGLITVPNWVTGCEFARRPPFLSLLTHR